MLFNSYDFLFCSFALTPLRSSCLKNTWQHNCIRESLQMIKENFHWNLRERKKKEKISILCYRELKIPFTELETETHVRDLFTRRYTLMFAQDKNRRGKVFKIKLGGKQIGSKAILTRVLSRKRRIKERKFLWFQKENLIKFKFFSFCDIDTDGSISEIGFKLPHSRSNPLTTRASAFQTVFKHFCLSVNMCLIAVA